jgi:hypothetical protein
MWLLLVTLSYLMGVHLTFIEVAECFRRDPDKAGVALAGLVIGFSWPIALLFVTADRLDKVLR